MTIHINVKDASNNNSEIAISGVYNGTIWLSYAEQVELFSWLITNRPDILEMIRNRRNVKK
jgi:hypothetical protein